MAVNGLVVAIFPLPPALLSLRVDMYIYCIMYIFCIMYILYHVILYHGQGGSLLCCGMGRVVVYCVVVWVLGMDAEQCKINLLKVF